MRKFLLPLAIISSLFLSGCSNTSGWGFFPGVHKVPIQQGTKITQDMVDKLRPGMTKAQVRYVLGTPLVVDTFDQDRWDFYYTFKLGSGEQLKEHLAVFFVNDLLDHFEGDFVPTSAVETEEELSSAHSGS